MTETTIINKNPDSLELGSPSKGGAIKVYLDFADKSFCDTKIKNALELRDKWAKLAGITKEEAK